MSGKMGHGKADNKENRKNKEESMSRRGTLKETSKRTQHAGRKRVREKSSDVPFLLSGEGTRARIRGLLREDKEGDVEQRISPNKESPCRHESSRMEMKQRRGQAGCLSFSHSTRTPQRVHICPHASSAGSSLRLLPPYADGCHREHWNPHDPPRP